MTGMLWKFINRGMAESMSSGDLQIGVTGGDDALPDDALPDSIVDR